MATPDPGRPRYDLAAYQPRGWADEDRDGCNTREEVLLAEGQAVRTGPGCKVLAGRWQDPFTGRRTTWPGDLEVDHLVSATLTAPVAKRGGQHVTGMLLTDPLRSKWTGSELELEGTPSL